MLRAGFFETDITPRSFPIRTYRGSADGVLDPLSARAAVFQCDETVVGLVSLDVVIVERDVVRRVRELATARCPIPKSNILVCATHNHACPAVIDRPGFPREVEYVEFMADRAACALARAFDNLREARIAAGSCVQSQASFNRRFITRDGCVVTQPRGADLARVLCNENVIDPEVGVLRVTDARGEVMGLLVNFGCHAVHHSGQISAGFPGVLCRRLKERLGAECGVVFLNGPCANVIHRDYLNPGMEDSKERTGGLLADAALRVLEDMLVPRDEPVKAASRRIRLEYRDFDRAEREFEDPAVRRNIFRGLVSDGWYDYAALKRMAEENGGGEEAEIQALRIGEAVLAAIPAEYFMEHGLRIKQESPARRTFVVSLANGWTGYIPTQAALQRKGGHETTTAFWSKMQPEAGDMMADAALELIRSL